MNDQTLPVSALPIPIAAYWRAANAGDVETAAQWFAPDAIVRDEGRTHQGHDAITAWIQQTTMAAQPVVTPLRWAGADGHLKVTASVAGSFPGSPVELDFAFVCTSGKIFRLTIE